MNQVPKKIEKRIDFDTQNSRGYVRLEEVIRSASYRRPSTTCAPTYIHSFSLLVAPAYNWSGVHCAVSK